jgi:hypothetical protein
VGAGRTPATVTPSTVARSDGSPSASRPPVRALPVDPVCLQPYGRWPPTPRRCLFPDSTPCTCGRSRNDTARCARAGQSAGLPSWRSSWQSWQSSWRSSCQPWRTVYILPGAVAIRFPSPRRGATRFDPVPFVARSRVSAVGFHATRPATLRQRAAAPQSSRNRDAGSGVAAGAAEEAARRREPAAVVPEVIRRRDGLGQCDQRRVHPEKEKARQDERRSRRERFCGSQF